ncbi:ras-related protein Rab-9B-like [Babylonia areolata]|uniref:ras-related protein Rab-9B-like n=1 Tax=Babylonia areolata TaxID=304850 RepID=UPI003FD3B311
MSGTTLLKVILLGDGGVGKSSLMKRFVDNKFDSQVFHTIGVEFLSKNVVVGQTTFTLQIWDTAGQERYRSLRTPFYRGTDCCLLTFSLNDKQSFEHLSMWHKEFITYADVQDGTAFPFVVIGNKADMKEEREVTSEEARKWCSSHGHLPYFEASAKESTNVENAFLAVIQRLLELEDQMEQRPMQGLPVDLRRARNRISC